MLDSRSRGSWFESHQRLCVKSLSKTLYPLLSIVDWDVKHNHYKRLTLSACGYINAVPININKKDILLILFSQGYNVYINPQSGAKGLFEIYFWNNCVGLFFVVRVKKGILRAVTLSINKAFIKPILTFWPFETIKHLYMPGPCGRK